VKILTSRGGSAAGPKPGRVGFYVELDGARSCVDMGFVTVGREWERTTVERANRLRSVKKANERARRKR